MQFEPDQSDGKANRHSKSRHTGCQTGHSVRVSAPVCLFLSGSTYEWNRKLG